MSAVIGSMKKNETRFRESDKAVAILDRDQERTLCKGHLNSGQRK